MIIMISNSNVHSFSRSKSNNNFWQDKNIQSVLGHPVKRVVCDKQGNIILDIGDIIGFRALEQVKQANELDYLFNSVYRK